MASQKTAARILTVEEALKRRSKVPASWDRVFGILKGRKPDALEQLKKMRQRDAARSRALGKRWKR